MFGTFLAVVSLAAGVVESMSSGADPTRSATIETYRSVGELHKRMENVEFLLLDIHTRIGNLPDDVRDLLENESAQQREFSILGTLSKHHSDRESYLAGIIAGVPRARLDADYRQAVATNRTYLSSELYALISAAPYSLESALKAIAAEAGMAAFLGDAPEQIQRVAELKLERLEGQLSGRVERDITAARDALSEQVSQIDARFGGDGWVEGGVFFRPEFSGHYHFDRFVLAACVDVDRHEHPAGGLPRYSVRDADRSSYDVSAFMTAGRYASEASLCGLPDVFPRQEVASTLSSKAKTDLHRKNDAALAKTGFLIGPRLKRELVPLFKGSLFGLGSLVYPDRTFESLLKSRPVVTLLEGRVNAFAQWKRDLDLDLTAYNLRADHLELLVGYQLVVRDGIEGLRQRIATDSHQLQDLLLMAEHAATVDDLFAGSVIDGERRVDQFDAERLRAQFSEVAKSIQTRVDAGARRHEVVLAAYERDQRYVKLAKALRTFVKAAETFKAATEILDKLIEVPAKTPAGPAVAAADGAPAPEKTPRAQILAALASAEPGPGEREVAGHVPAPGTGLPLVGNARFEKIKALLDELEALGPPSGDPSDITPIRQELVAAELLGIFEIWQMTEEDRRNLRRYHDKAAASALGFGASQLLDASLRPAFSAVRILLGPTRTGQATTNSIEEAHKFAKQLQPHLDQIATWRFSGLPPISPRDRVESLIRQGQGYPKMRAQ